MTAYCSVEVRAARMYEDPSPAEFCDNEVESEGDICGFHEADERDEYDRERFMEDAREDARFGE